MFWSRLEDDPLKALQNLPNLLQLTFSRQAYDGEQLHFKTGGFLKLKELGLSHLNGLYSLLIDEGALPLLEMLLIGPTPQLKEVPSGIHHLRNLKQLNLADMPNEFEDSLDHGPDNWIVEHVPVVCIGHKVRIGYYGYDRHILGSKHLERSRKQTINQHDDHKDNDSHDINSVEKG